MVFLLGVVPTHLMQQNYKNCRIKLSGLLYEENGTRRLFLFIKPMLLSELINLEIAKICINHSKNRLPLVFNNYLHLAKSSHSRLTRFFHSNQLIIPLFKTQRTQQSIKFTIAKI